MRRQTAQEDSSADHCFALPASRNQASARIGSSLLRVIRCRRKDRMKLSRTIRLMVPWVLGFYFVAQIIGITSLISVHLHHMYLSEVAIADDIARTDAVDHGHEHSGHHHHGAADPGDQCCTVHNHLSAVPPLDLTPDPVGTASASLVLPVLDRLVSAEPSLLERPPKLLLSV
jgi:hypothetical protein